MPFKLLTFHCTVGICVLRVALVNLRDNVLSLMRCLITCLNNFLK